mmetsp:Transcript_25556/g.4264  ORF Transcript_25556/g.4264 Transcript_25556/m.4264 type:complete len:87 (+) Transcript_25556:345-605(+)
MECENYTLCDHCRMSTDHPHRLKKIKVPQGCKPPQDIITILCDICNKNISNESRFDCATCQDFSVCETCYPDNGHEHELVSSVDTL